MPDDFQAPSEPADRSTERLDKLEAQLLRQQEFVRWLHGVTALPHIIGSAQREQAKMEAAVESERRCSVHPTQTSETRPNETFDCNHDAQPGSLQGLVPRLVEKQMLDTASGLWYSVGEDEN